MPTDREKALEMAREWLRAYGQSRWCEDPKCKACYRDLDSLSNLILRVQADALQSVYDRMQDYSRMSEHEYRVYGKLKERIGEQIACLRAEGGEDGATV